MLGDLCFVCLALAWKFLSIVFQYGFRHKLTIDKFSVDFLKQVYSAAGMQTMQVMYSIYFGKSILFPKITFHPLHLFIIPRQKKTCWIWLSIDS